MAKDTITIREHTTDSIDFQLLADNDPIDLSEVDHVVMEMKDKKGKTYSYSSSEISPKVFIIDASSGKVRFSPPNEQVFLATNSPYKGYWKVYIAPTVHYSVPEDKEFEIIVREEY